MDQSRSQYLAHHGVKGMKWGVRRDRKGRISARSMMKNKTQIKKKALKFQAKMEGTSVKKVRKKAYLNQEGNPRGYAEHFKRSPKALQKTYKKARGPIKASIRAINKNPEYASGKLKTDPKLRKKYHEEISKAVENQLNAAAALKGNNKTRQYRLSFSYDASKDIYPSVTIKANNKMSTRKTEKAEAKALRTQAKTDLKTARADEKARRDKAREEKRKEREKIKAAKAKAKAAKHADEDGEVVGAGEESGTEWPTLYPVVDDKGLIIDYTPERPEIKHSELMHHGVKGMRWGVRRDRKNRSSSAGRVGSALAKSVNSVKKVPGVQRSK